MKALQAARRSGLQSVLGRRALRAIEEGGVGLVFLSALRRQRRLSGMDSSVLQIVMALLPFAVLFVGFMVFKADALKLSLVVWVLEVAVCGFLYQMDIVRIVESSLWGNITLWTGFLVLWTGQVFGSCYRSTGLLNILLSTLGKIRSE